MNCPNAVNFTKMVLQAEFSVSVSWQNLSSCLWLLFNRVPGRLYLELQFFCAVANYGQVGVPDTTGSRLWALIVTQYQCHDMFSLTRVFCPLLCLGWTSIWLYCHLRNGKEHLCHETLSHSKAHLKFFLLTTYCLYCACLPCVCTTLNSGLVSTPLCFVFVNGVQVIQTVVWKEAGRAAAEWFTWGYQVDLHTVQQIPQGPVLSWHCQKEKVKAQSYSLLLWSEVWTILHKHFLWWVENQIRVAVFLTVLVHVGSVSASSLLFVANLKEK